MGPGSPFLHTPPGLTNCSPSISPKMSEPFGLLREISRPASPGQARPLQPWPPRHSPSRAVEQREAGAGIRGCRHLASPPPIWRARSTPGNWKTQRGEAASQWPARARAHARTDVQGAFSGDGDEGSILKCLSVFETGGLPWKCLRRLEFSMAGRCLRKRCL